MDCFEQVSFAFPKTKELESFPDLFKKVGNYSWDAELQSAIKFACQSIADRVMAGVKTFVLRSPTPLVRGLQENQDIIHINVVPLLKNLLA